MKLEIVHRISISWANAVRATTSLVFKGLLEFCKGIGMFARQPAISYDLRSLVSFATIARWADKNSSTSKFTFGKLKRSEVDRQLAERLRVTGPDMVWASNPIRAIDAIPKILEHRFVGADHCPKLTRLQAKGFLYQAWTEFHQLKIDKASKTVRAVLLKDEKTAHWEVPAGSPVWEVAAAGFLQGEVPHWWERTLNRADTYVFHGRLAPIQSASPLQVRFRRFGRSIDVA